MPTSESSLSTTTLQKAIAGDASSWQRVFHLYGPIVYGRCRRHGLREHDAADVVQEVFLAAVKSIGNFRREDASSSFRGWLLGIAANKLKDYWERQARQPQGEGGSEAKQWIDQIAASGGLSTSAADEAAEKVGVVRRAMELVQAEFEQRTWKAFCRFEIDGQRAADIAVELGMTANAVHVAACRVRTRLREVTAGLL